MTTLAFEDYSIGRFDILKAPQHKIWYILGRRGSGKTHLMTHLAYITRDRYDICLAFSPTLSTVKTMDGFVNAAYVEDQGFNEARLEQFVALVAELQRKNKYRSILILLDDISHDKSCMRSKLLAMLFCNGRHFNLTIFVTSQTLLSCGPDLRGQIDFIFILRNNIKSDREKLWKHFFGVFPLYVQFEKCFAICSDNRSALVLDNCLPNAEIEDCIHFYEAPAAIPDFKIGKQIFHKFGTVAFMVIARLKQKKDEEFERKYHHKNSNYRLVRVPVKKNGKK